MVERSSTSRGGVATESVRPFEHDQLAQRVVFGAGRAAEVGQELQALQVHRVLLVATASAKQHADHLAEALGDRVVARIHEVTQHVPEADAAAALSLARACEAQGLITLGGGSATGLGKAVAVETGLPLVAVPTTYAGSEATPVFGVTGERKRTGRDQRALPRTVVYDPALTTSMPKHVTAASGLNAVAHCAEALWAHPAEPVRELLASEGLRRLAGALPAATREPADLGARTHALYGAYLAGSALAASGSALHHTLCHVIGGTHRLGHGEVHAVLLPYVAAYNAAAAPVAMDRIATALGTSDAPAGLRALAETLGAPVALAALGLPRQALDDAVEQTVATLGNRNPRPVDHASLRAMLDDAYWGIPPRRY